MNGLESWTTSLMLVLARVGMFITVFPLFRAASVPRLVKVVLSLSLSVMWLVNFMLDPAVSLPVDLSPHWLVLGMAIAREAIIGGMLGYALGLFLLPGQVAGYYLSQELGFTLGGLSDPTSETPSSVFGELLNSLAMLVFLCTDIYQLAIGTLYASFTRLPLGQPLRLFRLSVISQGLSEAHRWGLELAAPMAIGLFLITVLLALLMRVSPQLNLFTVGTSLRLMGGLFVCFVLLPDLLLSLRSIVLRSCAFVERLGW